MTLSLEQYRSHQYLSGVKDILTERIDMQINTSTGIALENVDRIPDHLIIEMLSWLPVRTLLQFKSVCKTWYTVIKSSYFISKHLRNYYHNDTNWRDCLIVQYSEYLSGWLDVYKLLIDNKTNRVLSDQEIYTPVNNPYLCGPCDGIYYLSCSYRPARFLWNPALNEFKSFSEITWKPNLPHRSSFTRENHGFGYDPKTKDYKVVLIKSLRDEPKEDSRWTLSILIYSLKNNSWRDWSDVDRSYKLRQDSKSYVFVNGCYHWIDSSRCSETLLVFYISEGVFNEIPLPRFEDNLDHSQLLVYEESISVVRFPTDRTSFSIWTRNKEVWTQKLTMKESLVSIKDFNQLASAFNLVCF